MMMLGRVANLLIEQNGDEIAYLRGHAGRQASRMWRSARKYIGP